MGRRKDSIFALVIVLQSSIIVRVLHCVRLQEQWLAHCVVCSFRRLPIKRFEYYTCAFVEVSNHEFHSFKSLDIQNDVIKHMPFSRAERRRVVF